MGVSDGPAYLLGGVDGGCGVCLLLFLAGVGELARYSSRSAPLFSASMSLSIRAKRAGFGGGVRGGEELIIEELTSPYDDGGGSGSFSSSEVTWTELLESTVGGWLE